MARRVWGLLVVLCLNMAVLPCAMAVGLDSHECAHCPPAEQHEMAAHHGHDEQQLRSPCAEAQSQCCEFEAASIDTRAGKLKVRDTGDLEIVAMPSPAADTARTALGVDVVIEPPDPPAAFPPRHLLFCVFLD